MASVELTQLIPVCQQLDPPINEPAIFDDGQGQPVCFDGEWVAIPADDLRLNLALRELPLDETALLIGAGLLTCVLAFGFKLLRRTFGARL